MQTGARNYPFEVAWRWSAAFTSALYLSRSHRRQLAGRQAGCVDFTPNHARGRKEQQ
jgi:hypothetical protein